MEVRTEKSKILTNSTNNISANISMNTHKLEEVTSFKYREAKTLCKDGTFSAEVRDQNCFSNGSNSQFKHYMKQGPCLLTLKKGFRPSKSSALGSFSASPT